MDNTENAGFTDGTPWIEVNPNCARINTLDREDPDSIFQHYRKLTALRKELPVISQGDVTPILEEDENLLAYRRRLGGEELWVVCNFFGKTVPVPEGILPRWEAAAGQLSGRTWDGKTLQPYEAVMIYKK